MIPPAADCKFIACLENVLDTYTLSYDPRFPVVCMDEQPVQLTKETRLPIPATKRHPRRVDYEYERAGTASLFMFTEPLVGWRDVTVRQQRTKVDWAIEIEHLLRVRYAEAERIILICDNLNTHTMGAFYSAFPAEYARKLEALLKPRLGSKLCKDFKVKVIHRGVSG